MPSFLNTYQRSQFEELLQQFHTYVNGVLAETGTDNQMLEQILAIKQDPEVIDPVGLEEERNLWRRFLPGREGLESETPAELQAVRDTLQTSRSLRILLFPNKTADQQTAAVNDFLQILPRRFYQIKQLPTGEQLQLSRTTVHDLANLLVTRVQPSDAGLIAPPAARAAEPTKSIIPPAAAPNTGPATPPAGGAPASNLLGPTREALQHGELQLPGQQTTGKEQDQATKTTTTKGQMTTEELQQQRRQEQETRRERRRRLAQQQAQARSQKRREIIPTDQLRTKGRGKAQRPRRDRSHIKRAGIIAATTAGTGLIGALPALFNFIS